MSLVRIKGSKPMMSDEEIEIIDSLLLDMMPQHCLEWGAGNSTVFFPEHFDRINCYWLSVEHSGHYVEYLKNKINDRTTVIWADKEWYIDCVKLGRKYDFILVDGIQREKCVEEGLKLLNPNGVLLLHDAGRAEYLDLIEKYDAEILTQGEKRLKDGSFAHRGLALFRRQDVNI